MNPMAQLWFQLRSIQVSSLPSARVRDAVGTQPDLRVCIRVERSPTADDRKPARSRDNANNHGARRATSSRAAADLPCCCAPYLRLEIAR